MSDEPQQDHTSEFTGPVWDPGQSAEPGDYVMLGAPPMRAGRSRRLAIGAGIAAVAMLGGAGAAYAISGSGTPAGTVAASSSGSSPAPHRTTFSCKKSAAPCPGMHGHFPFRRIGNFPFGGEFGGMFGSAVHGQAVIAKPGGGYVTVDVQSGKVVSVGSSAITVRSPDGFSASYIVAGTTVVGAQRAGIGSVKVGDEVWLQATVSGSKTTATSVIDLTLLKKNHSSIGFGWQGSAGGPPPGNNAG